VQFFKDIIAMTQITFYKTVGSLPVISGGVLVLGVCLINSELEVILKYLRNLKLEDIKKIK
jgi:Na+-translocating ferredoxin:NAD+ oxidoreductase RnfA subunit